MEANGRKQQETAERKHYILITASSPLHTAPVASLLKELSITGGGYKERSLHWKSEVDPGKGMGESYFPYETGNRSLCV